MRQLLTTLFITSLSASAFAQTISWGTPVSIYSVGASHNNHPRIALNRSGDPYVIFGQTDTRVYFSKWSGSAFTAPAVVSGSLTVFSQAWAGPDLAASGDTVYVTMKATPEMTSTNYSYLAHSYDGGATFAAPVRIDNIGSDLSRFPIVTTTSTGNPLVSFMKFDSGTMANARYVVCRSSDFGVSFTSDVLASKSTSPVCDCCPAALISSGTKAIMLYRDDNSNIRDIWAGLSNDGGATFPNNVRVDTTNWNISACPASGPDGFVIGDTIYSVYMSSASGPALVHLSKESISGMAGFNNRITGPFTGLSTQNYPRIDHAGNTAVAVWVQNVSGTRYIAYSVAGNIASGLSGYNILPGSTSSSVMNADLAVAPGVVHIVWEDDNSGKVMYVKGTYTLSATAAVGNVSSKSIIEVYPNPDGPEFSVALGNIDGISSCFLSDVAGRTIALQPEVKNGTASFSLKGIAKGSYYFVLEDMMGNMHYCKLVVE